jgi:hypothetical protein
MKIIACYYSFDDTCLLIANIDENQNLVIEKAMNQKRKQINEVAEILESYQLPIWINKHEPLKLTLKKSCNEIDFDGDEEKELQSISDLFETLKDSKRIVLNQGLNISRIEKGNFRKCLNIALKGLIHDLCNPKNDIEDRIESIPLKNFYKRR